MALFGTFDLLRTWLRKVSGKVTSREVDQALKDRRPLSRADAERARRAVARAEDQRRKQDSPE
jgi:hypothetical protein